jgi:hypothetical protein
LDWIGVALWIADGVGGNGQRYDGENVTSKFVGFSLSGLIGLARGFATDL